MSKLIIAVSCVLFFFISHIASAELTISQQREQLRAGLMQTYTIQNQKSEQNKAEHQAAIEENLTKVQSSNPDLTITPSDSTSPATHEPSNQTPAICNCYDKTVGENNDPNNFNYNQHGVKIERKAPKCICNPKDTPKERRQSAPILPTYIVPPKKQTTAPSTKEKQTSPTFDINYR